MFWFVFSQFFAYMFFRSQNLAQFKAIKCLNLLILSNCQTLREKIRKNEGVRVSTSFRRTRLQSLIKANLNKIKI